MDSCADTAPAAGMYVQLLSLPSSTTTIEDATFCCASLDANSTTQCPATPLQNMRTPDQHVKKMCQCYWDALSRPYRMDTKDTPYSGAESRCQTCNGRPRPPKINPRRNREITWRAGQSLTREKRSRWWETNRVTQEDGTLRANRLSTRWHSFSREAKGLV